MAITNEFREAVELGKKVRVRIMLKDSMLVDVTMRQFDEMLDYALVNISDLYDEHDEEELKYSSSEWNEAYLNSQMVSVVSNFSKERVDLLKNIVKFLYRDKDNCIIGAEVSTDKPIITRNQVGIGMTTVGAVVTVSGIFSRRGVLIVGGLCLAACGVSIVFTDKEE